jgi:phage portal protein BeeE
LGILQRLDARLTAIAQRDLPARSVAYPTGLSVQGYVDFLQSMGGLSLNQTLVGNHETVDPTFVGYASAGYAGNAIVFACMQVRLSLFSEARFQFRQLRSGRPGDLFGSPALRRLEQPWPGGTTGDLLARMMVSNDLAGNAFVVATAGGGCRVLRPDWVTMVLGSERAPATRPEDVDAELIGLLYHPGGRHTGTKPEVFLRGDFAHFAPLPDPLSPYRGMPWIAPVVREIQGDTGYTTHKLKFLENGATVNMVVSLDASIGQAAFQSWVDAFEAGHKGAANAYKTLYLGAGASATPVGSDMEKMDFKAVQGAGETRIAAAAGVPPVVVGFSEGLQGSSLNAGNYVAARRRLADLTMRPLWRNAAGSLASLVQVPSGAELWYDDRDIAFLQEDVKDAAEIQQMEALTIRQLVDAGFTPDDVVESVTAGDLRRLRNKHTGLFSVQLQEPGTTAPTPVAPPPARDALLDMVDAIRAMPAPVVNVPAPIVNVAAPIVDVPPTVVNVEPAVVNVPPAVITVDVPPTVVNVEAPVVHVPETVVHVEAPVVNVPETVVSVAPAVVNVPEPVVHIQPQPEPSRDSEERRARREAIRAMNAETTERAAA